MKQNEKQKTGNNQDELKEFTGLLAALFKELFMPEPSKVQLPPPPRPVNVQLIVLPRKKGVIRRFLNWLW